MTPAAPNRRPLRVIKLGGSLLNCGDLAARFHAWLPLQPAATNLVVAGGGELVEAIRNIDRARPLGDAAAHHLCIRAMSLTAELAAGLLGGCVLDGWPLEAGALAGDDARPYVVDVAQFIAHDRQQSRDPLPETWQVTSDSIAARLAATLRAAELVLLKSALPEGDTLEELAAEGYVDGFFPRSAVTRPLRIVNLREPAESTERAWRELPRTAAASVSAASTRESR